MFIVFEGPDGAGKSTLAAHAAAHLRSKGCTVHSLRHPGSTRLGEDLREILKHAAYKFTHVAEYLCFMAAMHELNQHISQLLLKGDSVILDRYWPSTIIYQHYGRGVSMQVIFDVLRHAMATDSGRQLAPDALIVVTAAPDACKERVTVRGGTSRFDDDDFSGRVRDAYAGLISTVSDPKNITAWSAIIADNSFLPVSKWHVVDNTIDGRQAVIDILGHWLGHE